MKNVEHLIESYARRLAQTPHTGDEKQDTETYKHVLRAMIKTQDDGLFRDPNGEVVFSGGGRP
jgi:hypothetical protein